MQNHCFNILTFNHPQEKLTFYFTNVENETLTRVYHSLVPDGVIEEFGEQEHCCTSFTKEVEGLYPVTKAVNPSYETKEDENGEERSYRVHNSAFTTSILKRFYKAQIHEYFKSKDFLVKPNFIHDTEIWLPSKKYDKTGHRYTLKVQFKTVTKQAELLVTFEATSKVYKKSYDALQDIVSPTNLNWVIFDNGLYKFEEFKKFIPINSNGFIPVEEIRLGRVKSNSNQLFGDSHTDIVPMNGMKELVVGVGAFKNPDFDIQYIGSAFSFSNNGRFNRFECFQQGQTRELAGSIIKSVKDYAALSIGNRYANRICQLP